ncbi:MAG: putative Ig domain-containing protein [Melioribacteraceae bacterium]
MKRFILLVAIISFSVLFAQSKSTKENHAPVFVKEMPDTFILAGKTLLFQYTAFDPDGDSITYSAKSVLPTNSTLLPKTGVFSWHPFNAQRGMYELIIAASDEKLTTDYHWDDWGIGTPHIAIAHNVGGEVSRSTIGDTAIVRAIPNKGYRFTNWTENGIIVSTDSVYQFVITISRDLLANFRVNHAPVFVKEMPDTTIFDDRAFIFTYRATDADGDTIKYIATSTIPNNALLITETGVFGWRPNYYQQGIYQIMVYVTDGNAVTNSRKTKIVVLPATCCSGNPFIILRALPEGSGVVSYNRIHDTLTAKAVSNKGFRFVNWTEYGTIVSEDSSYTYVAAEMRNLAAHFAPLTSVYTDQTLPKEFRLMQNFPNPFNPATTINFSVPKNGYVTLKVFDSLGREVATIVNEYKQPGNYQVKLNVKTRHGASLPSGIYFYQLTADQTRLTRKMVIVK